MGNVVSLKDTRMINNAVNEIFSRQLSEGMGRLGRSWYSETTGVAKRNLYESLGYIKDLTFDNYMARYKRGDIAKRVVNAPVDASWRLPPLVTELREPGVKDKGSGDQTAFEEDWAQLIKDAKVFHYLVRGDRISGIGQYGVIVLGFDDSNEMKDEVVPGSGRKLLYMMPYTQNRAAIDTWDNDQKSSRFGLPETYQITTSIKGAAGGSQSLTVHHSRVLHLAQETTENDVYGTPQMEDVYNRLQDLELVAGGSGEMYWRGALPGFNFKIDKEADMSTVDTSDLKEQIELYIHGLQRFFRTQGMDVQSLAPQVVSPKDHVDVQLTLIAATKGIPKRILEGSERGELASSQDENSWHSKIDERREQYVTPMILRPFIQKLIDAKVLNSPGENGFSISWPSLFSPGAIDRSVIAKNKSEALTTYVSGEGSSVIPPEIFLRDFLEYNEEQIQEITGLIEGIMEEDKNNPLPKEEDFEEEE